MALRRALLLLAVGAAEAAGRKRRRAEGAPAIPPELDAGCPFWRDEPDARELSEFGHELERDGRQDEAVPCYVKAIRTSPESSLGWLDLAVAKQHTDPSLAIKLYRHGLKLKPTDHELYNQFGVLLRANGRQEEALHHFVAAGRLKPDDADAFFRERRRLLLLAARRPHPNVHVPAALVFTKWHT